MKYSLYVVQIVGWMYTLFMILFMVGFFKTTPPFFVTITFALKVTMALFLVYRFNPYFNTSKKFTDLDREIILFSAFFILVSSFTDYIHLFIDKAKMFVSTLI